MFVTIVESVVRVLFVAVVWRHCCQPVLLGQNCWGAAMTVLLAVLRSVLSTPCVVAVVLGLFAFGLTVPCLPLVDCFVVEPVEMRFAALVVVLPS